MNRNMLKKRHDIFKIIRLKKAILVLLYEF